MHHLEVNAISVSLEQKKILNDLTFSVETGEIICLLGLSGEGKTTLLRTIAGFIKPSLGEIKILNTVVADSSKSIPVEHRKLGMVFQDFALFPHLSVKDNIVFGIQSLSYEQRNDKLKELIK